MVSREWPNHSLQNYWDNKKFGDEVLLSSCMRCWSLRLVDILPIGRGCCAVHCSQQVLPSGTESGAGRKQHPSRYRRHYESWWLRVSGNQLLLLQPLAREAFGVVARAVHGEQGPLIY